MQIAIMGFGTIGSGVAELLLKNQKSIVAKSGQASLEVKHILDIRDFSGHELEKYFTKDFNDILNDPAVSIVVECMGIDKGKVVFPILIIIVNGSFRIFFVLAVQHPSGDVVRCHFVVTIDV